MSEETSKALQLVIRIMELTLPRNEPVGHADAIDCVRAVLNNEFSVTFLDEVVQ